MQDMDRNRTLAAVGVVAVIVASAAVAWLAQDRREEPGPQSLAAAVAAGDVAGAQTLLAAGADPEEPRLNGFTPLMRAALRNDAAMVEVLLDAGAAIDAAGLEGVMAIHLAAEADATEAFDTLLAGGADPGLRSGNGMDALDHAAAADAAGVISLIAATGIDLDTPSEVVTQGHGYPIDVGSTPLGIAARAGQLAAVSALLDNGAAVDARSTTGNTPLLLAVFAGQSPELVSVLLDAGADPAVEARCTSRCSFEGGDALAWARHLNRTDLIPLLESTPARQSGFSGHGTYQGA